MAAIVRVTLAISFVQRLILTWLVPILPSRCCWPGHKWSVPAVIGLVVADIICGAFCADLFDTFCHVSMCSQCGVEPVWFQSSNNCFKLVSGCQKTDLVISRLSSSPRFSSSSIVGLLLFDDSIPVLQNLLLFLPHTFQIFPVKFSLGLCH